MTIWPGRALCVDVLKVLKDRSFESPHPSLALVRLEFSLEFYIDEEFQSILSFCPKNH